MPDIQIGAAIDAVDELLRRGGQPPKIGAGTSQPPPVNNAPSRFGASALTAPKPDQNSLVSYAPGTFGSDQMPAKNLGAPGGTAPFMPAKIGASPQPAMPSSPKIGAGMDTYDPSQSPMPGGGQPDYSAQYAAVHDPVKPGIDAGKPSTLRKIGGIALGAGIGAFNPQAGAQIGSSIVNGPRNELMRQYNQDEGLANQQRERIKTEAGLADTGSQMEQRQAQAVRDRAEAQAKLNPQPKETEEKWTTVPGVTGPNGEPVQQEEHSGQQRVSPLQGATVMEKGGSSKPTEQDKEVSDYLAAHNLQDTPANREKARAAVRAELRPPAAPKPPPAEGSFERSTGEGASKDVESARGGDFRYRSMAGSLPRAKAGDQQAMLNLLTNHIGMTLGMQKGARITKDILHEATNSAPWLQGLKAKFDDRGFLSGVVLTPQQMDQMMELATSQRSNAWAQAIESARQAGVADKVQIPADVRIRVQSPDGKVGSIPGNQLSQAEKAGYVVAPQ